MNIKELMEKLSQMPPDAEVMCWFGLETVESCEFEAGVVILGSLED